MITSSSNVLKRYKTIFPWWEQDQIFMAILKSLDMFDVCALKYKELHSGD